MGWVGGWGGGRGWDIGESSSTRSKGRKRKILQNQGTWKIDEKGRKEGEVNYCRDDVSESYW